MKLGLLHSAYFINIAIIVVIISVNLIHLLSLDFEIRPANLLLILIFRYNSLRKIFLFNVQDGP
jgi:hypothetical protein